MLKKTPQALLDADKLQEAIDLLNKDGWGQRFMYSPYGPRCLLGAIARVTIGCEVYPEDIMSSIKDGAVGVCYGASIIFVNDEMRDGIQQAIRIRNALGFDSDREAYHFNDHYCSGKSEVIDRMTKGIAKLKADADLSF